MTERTLRAALAGALAALGVRRTVGLNLGMTGECLLHIDVEAPDLAVVLADVDETGKGGLVAAVVALSLIPFT